MIVTSPRPAFACRSSAAMRDTAAFSLSLIGWTVLGALVLVGKGDVDAVAGTNGASDSTERVSAHPTSPATTRPPMTSRRSVVFGFEFFAITGEGYTL